MTETRLIARDLYLRRIAPFIDKPIVKVITGIRRCGKSSLLRLLRHDLEKRGVPLANIVHINMESLAFEHITDHRALQRHVGTALAKKRGRCYLFVDEIQEIENWEKAIASFLADEVADLVITGSNAHLLASDLATRLSGRHVEIRMLPLGFREFLKFRRKKPDGADRDDEFARFLRYGGFPGIHAFSLSDEVVFQYLDGIYNTVLMKDVVHRFAIRDISLLENVVRFIFDNCGNITTAKRMADYLKAQKRPGSVETIQNYLSFLERSFLIAKASRLDLKGLRLLELYEKYYVTDFGLRHSLLGYRSDDIGGLLEGVVYLELVRRGFTVHIGKLEQREIDFVAERDGKRCYFQVCHLLADKATVAREFGALERIPDHCPKYVLSLDKSGPAYGKGLHWQNLVEFLVHE